MQFAASPSMVSSMDRAIARRRIAGPIPLVAAAFATALAAIAWFVLSPSERTFKVEASKVTISQVAEAPFHDFIPVRGQVVPLETVVLDAVQGGRVEVVLAEDGQHVTTGQPLIRLSNPALELDAIARETQVIEQINSQRAQQLNYEQTRTSDVKAVVDADYQILRLSRQLARRRPLAASGFVPREMMDQWAAELTYQRQLKGIVTDALQRDTAVIERSTELMRTTAARLDANLAAAKGQLDALTVRAPADGVLTGLDAHVGEEKVRGQHLGQIDRDGGFKVTAQVDEFYLANVKTGQPVAVNIDGTPGTLIVTKIYPQVKDRRFEIDLAWKGAMPLGLRRGQAIQGKLELGDDVPAVVLPAGPFLESSGGTWVFVLDPGVSRAVRRPVKLGRRTAEAAEVLSGLAPGERVVTSDYTGLERIDRLTLSQ